MKIMLDTNMCIYCMKEGGAEILNRVRKYKIDDVGISSITLSELMYGVEKSVKRDYNFQNLKNFISGFDIAPYDEFAAIQYGAIRQYLEKKGTLIGPLDMLIAAHALSLKAMLITNNLKEFERVPDLKLENWIRR